MLIKRSFTFVIYSKILYAPSTSAFQLMEIKQEVFDETVYHDAVDSLLDEVDEIDDNNHNDGDHGEEGEIEENDDSDQGSPACNDSRL
jgi:hypothetical protein